MCSLSIKDDPSEVGRHGILRLEFEKRKDRTILSQSYSKSPMHIFQPFYPDETGCAFTHLFNAAGGLVCGDRIEIHIILNENSHVFATTPSATKIYRSSGDSARQQTEITIRKGGVFEYLPSYVIPFANSSYRQKMKLSMEEDTVAFVLDFFTTGRLARGEHLQFDQYSSITEINYCGEPILFEKATLKPLDTDYGDLGLLESFVAAASVYLIFDNPRIEKDLLNILRAGVGDLSGVMGGASTLPSKGVIVRLLGSRTRFIERAILEIWSVAREHIFGRKPFSQLRRVVPF
jgi:urease accessory protein